jgi:hypothetical protein
MPRTRLAAAALAAVLTAVGVLAVSVVVPALRTPVAQGAPPPSHDVVPVEPWPESRALRAVRVLEAWQERRARAYSSGDVAALRRLYVPGSEAGRRDCAVLAAYAARGVTLRLQTHTTRLSVLASRSRHVVLRQRAVVRTVARLLHGRERALPSPGAQWRRVVLRLEEGRWLLSAATPGRPGSPREPP